MVKNPLYHLSSFKLLNWGHTRRRRKITKIINTFIIQLLGITIFSLIHVGYLTLIKCRMFFFGFKQRFVISMRKTNFCLLSYVFNLLSRPGRFSSIKNFWNFAKVKYPTREGFSFHIFMDKTNTKLVFLYVVGTVLKSW